MTRRAALGALAAIGVSAAAPPAEQFPLASLEGVNVTNLKGEAGTYRGKRAIHLLNSPATSVTSPGDAGIAVVGGTDFADGTIEIDVSGAPRSGADGSARGFVGLAFRVQPDNTSFECFYLRPTNGRAKDQLRRNHSVQYMAIPNYPWARLRQENPGVYESYCDLEPVAWTHMKIVVSGVEAQLFVNEASQPCLIVNDLKLGRTKGRIALWVGQETDAWFSNLTAKSG